MGGRAAPKSVVHNWNDFENLSENTTGILVVLNSYNEGTVLDLDPFKSLQYLEIGDDSFKNVTTFNINGLSKLTLIYIGKSSFTQERENALYSFRLLNCDSLINLEIGQYSFSEYTGVIELSKSSIAGEYQNRNSGICFFLFFLMLPTHSRLEPHSL